MPKPTEKLPRCPVHGAELICPYCHVHGDRMICPTHEGSKGGRKTARLYKDKLSAWGKMGGRPRKGTKPKPAS